MVSLKTHISWTDSTWNPTTGCTKVSAGCVNCYAEALTNRLFGGGFDVVKMHPGRLAQVRAFQPIREGGRLRPRMVFVNSMSDVFHKDVPDEFRDRIFDAIEGQPRTIFQILTKRPMTLRHYVERRYKASGVSANVWLGASVEDNRVRHRIDILRALKDAVGPLTAFLSVEPLIGPVDRHDYRGIDQVLIGGESGPRARPMEIDWARCARDNAGKSGTAVWFKQFGTWGNNPLYQRSTAKKHIDRVRDAIAGGEQLAWIDPGTKTIRGEKGGATLDGAVLRELPPAFHHLARQLNTGLL